MSISHREGKERGGNVLSGGRPCGESSRGAVRYRSRSVESESPSPPFPLLSPRPRPSQSVSRLPRCTA
ncbi:hypothetical protein J6590_037352 [Homalodisca vitripennis]|nr:hypothetical protein J6590_037352 [Homalodisca vitripennis]